MSSEEEIYQSVAEELRRTLENQQRAYARTNQMAVDLVKINVVTLGATIAGVSLSGTALRLPLIGGILTFSYAIWCCLRVYEPRPLTYGLGVDVVEEIDEAVRNGMAEEEHYRRLAFSYREAVSHLSVAHSSVRETVRNALWASVATIAFFGAVTIRQLLSWYPPSFDLVLFAGISTVAIWRWNRTMELRS